MIEEKIGQVIEELSLSRHSSSDLKEHTTPRKKIRLGICCMEGKLKGKPMVAILGFLEKTGEFEICPFNNDMILNQPIENWLRCDVLLAFYSHGFPLDRAIQYVNKYKPALINDLES